MPHGLKRYHQSKQSHFITFTCYRRLRHLATPEARDIVVAALEHARARYRFRVYGFVVMLEHVHLLVSEPDKGMVANAMQSLKISSALRTAGSRQFEGRRSSLWQKRSHDRNVRDYQEFVEKLRYIHRNPVKRGLCARPEDWKWSSFRHYASGEDCGVEIESQWTADKRNRNAGKAVSAPPSDSGRDRKKAPG
jgi:putative transposase